ncbi:MAG: major capsid protein [Nitrososphaeria archaeon]
MKTLDAFDSGSNYKFGDKLQRPMLPRSLFDLSHLNTMTIDNAGELIPIALFETVPGDSFELSVKSLLRVLPLAVPLYSKQRLYIHAFYSRMSDLWNNAQTFMTKGYTGNTVLKIPTLNDNNLKPFGFTPAVEPNTLFDYLGIPIGTTRSQIIDADINALPFMMYKRIYRDYYMNKNFYINNRRMLPDDDHDFMLDNQGNIVSNSNPGTGEILLGDIEYRDYPQDYFLSALPFPQRGDTPTLGFNLTIDNLMDVGVTDQGVWKPLFASFWRAGNGAIGTAQDGMAPFNISDSYSTDDSINALAFGSKNAAGQAAVAQTPDLSIQTKLEDALAYSSITLNQLRELSSQQAILEKMARTDGSYAEFGLTFFNRVSKSAQDYKPLFIGGTYQSIAFTEVLQTTPTADSPLGNYAGHGLSYNDNGYIGTVDCDDYGYIMLIASIMPDVYYSQGLDRTLTKSLQSDMYLPERAKLGMREILNKELYFTGDPEVDNDLFAYQTPYDELRYKNSVIHGKIADPSALSFFPYTQSRKFTSLPTYSQSFAKANTVRKDYLAAPTEVAYTAQFDIQCRAVRPIPYNPVPAQII